MVLNILLFLLGHYNNDYQNYTPGCQDYDHYVGVHPGLSYYSSNNAPGQQGAKIDGNAYHVYDTGVPPNQMGHEYNETVPTPPSPSACSESPPPQQLLAQGDSNFYLYVYTLSEMYDCGVM